MYLLQYFAHTGNTRDQTDWHLLKDHLKRVSLLTASSSAKFGMGEFGKVVGLLHDVGKYSNEFQEKLKGEYTGKVDHSTAGAQIAFKKYECGGVLMSYCIAGHHAGLPNWIKLGSESGLKRRLDKNIPDCGKYSNFIDLPETPPIGLASQTNPFYVSVLIRMLFSCLIDADRTDTVDFAIKTRYSNRIPYDCLLYTSPSPRD